MATILPFKAVRPTRDKVGLFATRTYLSYSKEGLKEKLINNPYTFLQIINPDFNETNKSKGTKKLELIKKKFQSFIQKKIIQKDSQEALYIYSLNHENKEYKGIIATTLTDDYANGTIKKHEKTIKKREELFTEYLYNVNFNADPVLLSYKSNEKINQIIESLSSTRPEYEFSTSNMALHKLWMITKNKDILKITEEFKKINSLYIADGHHRSASSYRLSKNNGPNYFMSFLLDEKQINIYSFNRIIKNIDINLDKFLQKISNSFKLKEISNLEFQSENENEILVYFNNTFLSIIPKEKISSGNILSKLSYSILNDKILKDILNLDFNKQDIQYQNGKIKNEEIIEIINREKKAIGFILKPIKIDVIKKIADENLTLPPKSTYIEPKLRSGITILDLK